MEVIDHDRVEYIENFVKNNNNIVVKYMLWIVSNRKIKSQHIVGTKKLTEVEILYPEGVYNSLIIEFSGKHLNDYLDKLNFAFFEKVKVALSL